MSERTYCCHQCGFCNRQGYQRCHQSKKFALAKLGLDWLEDKPMDHALAGVVSDNLAIRAETGSCIIFICRFFYRLNLPHEGTFSILECMSYYRLHLFFCTNLKDSGKPCCAEKDAKFFWMYAKERLKVLGIFDVRVNQAGCLGKCLLGPSLVVYPDNVWYSYSTNSDIDDIIEKHIQNNQIVERLLMKRKEVN